MQISAKRSFFSQEAVAGMDGIRAAGNRPAAMMLGCLR